MMEFDMNDITWITPKKKTKWAINIPNGSAFNINAALCPVLPQYIAIGLYTKGHILAIRPGKNGDYKVPKNGTIKNRDLITTLEKAESDCRRISSSRR